VTVIDGSTFCVCDERGDVDGVAKASGFFEFSIVRSAAGRVARCHAAEQVATSRV
jgi:hypothetical protein